MSAKRMMNTTQGTKIFVVIFALITILGFVSILSPDPKADPPAPATEQALQPSSTYSGYLFRVVAVTLLLIVFLVIGLRLYRKQILLKGKNSLNMNLLGRYYINDKQYLLKVSIDDRNLLLGVSDSSINLITELDMDEAEAEISDRPFGTILDLETNKERPA